ncbi:MAG TPA: DUF4240 domain-containing protein [Saprospiraceae bacterium]|nr:DUF4240 domain-containing protein [Saprospiraceae bacterium]HRK80896.1 DUF4240 domain-containing protein [Saprospiraceae bacterium]
MTTAIKLPLRSLNESVIRDLKEKYPEAEISVELHQDRNKSPLSEAAFWEMISLLDWSKEGHDEEIAEPVIAKLAAGPIRHIFEFADILSEKLYALDARKYAIHIGEDAWAPDQYFSVDNFLYARCCVVANGKDAYNSALHNPAQMPKDLTFEALLYLPLEAYERKTGNRYDYTPAYPIETYSNQAGWSEETT